jgi:predicted PurR-regulated permease PerM
MSGDRSTSAMLGLCTVLVGAAIYFSGSIFAPLAFVLFMLAIVWPLQKTLQTFLPKTLALLLSLLVTVVVITVFASTVAWGFSVIGQWMIANAARFQTVYGGFISPLAVVFTVFFWACLWGIPGALIGVPITIAALVFCRHTNSCRWIAELFSGRPDEIATDAP